VANHAASWPDDHARKGRRLKLPLQPFAPGIPRPAKRTKCKFAWLDLWHELWIWEKILLKQFERENDELERYLLARFRLCPSARLTKSDENLGKSAGARR